MTCPKCQHAEPQRFGTYGARKVQRYRCRDCAATFSRPQPNTLGRHVTSQDMAARIIALLMEGVSIRAVSRLTGVHKNTISRLLLTIGDKCQQLFDAQVRNVRPRFIEADELWTFVQKKAETPEIRRSDWIRRCLPLVSARCGDKSDLVVPRRQA